MDNKLKYKITAPEGYVIDREKTTSTEIYFKKADRFDALSTVDKCKKSYLEGAQRNPTILQELKQMVPSKYSDSLLSLIYLLYCRDTWWKVDNYKPDFDIRLDRFIITASTENNIFTMDNVTGYYLLTFRTKEIRDRFLETFRPLIEEAIMFI
jgi:hypothetical protein